MERWTMRGDLSPRGLWVSRLSPGSHGDRVCRCLSSLLFCWFISSGIAEEAWRREYRGTWRMREASLSDTEKQVSTPVIFFLTKFSLAMMIGIGSTSIQFIFIRKHMLDNVKEQFNSLGKCIYSLSCREYDDHWLQMAQADNWSRPQNSETTPLKRFVLS